MPGYFIATATAASALLFITAAAQGPQQQPVMLTFDDSTPLRSIANGPQFLSFNIDTASLYQNLDLRDPTFINLVRQLSPAVIRIGGTAADSMFYTSTSSRHGGDGAGHTLVNDDLWDEINAFIAATNTTLLWNLNGASFRTRANAWDPRGNATAFLNRTAAAGYSNIQWSIGNEYEVWSPPPNGTTVGSDAVALKKLLQVR